MKIMKGELIPVVMQREDPDWRHALSSPEGEGDIRGFILRLATDNGFSGFGYADPPAHHGISYGGLQAALEAYMPLLEGQDPFNMAKISDMINRVLPGNNEAQSVVDFALHDLQARAMGLPLYSLLGGLVREKVPIARIMALKPPSQMAANALKLVDQGYKYLKVKLNGGPAEDIERVKTIRRAVGDGVHLMVDANQMYSPKVAIDTLKRMVEYGVDLCEQPVHADDWEGLAAVTRGVDCLVEAHESALSVENIFRLVKDRVVDSINLKIGQIGGLRQAMKAAAICRAGNVALRVSATGSRLLSAASMHFVASAEDIFYACELGEFSRLLNDPVEGLEVEEGMLKVPTSPGVGVSLRE